VDKLPTWGIEVYCMGIAIHLKWIFFRVMRINIVKASRLVLFGDKLSPNRVDKIDGLLHNSKWLSTNLTDLSTLSLFFSVFYRFNVSSSFPD